MTLLEKNKVVLYVNMYDAIREEQGGLCKHVWRYQRRTRWFYVNMYDAIREEQGGFM